MNDTSIRTRKPQLEDIAGALGLSKSTVSRAISGKGRVSAQTRERVFRCMRELNYLPPDVQTAHNITSHNVGIVIPIDSTDDEAPFFHECIIGAGRECAVRDYDTMVIGIEKNDLSRLISVIDKRKVDGMIISRPLADTRMETLLKEKKMPFVVLGKSMLDNVTTIDSNHTEGCRQLTLYLMMTNSPDNIALILGNMNHTVNRSRYEGFRKAFAAAGRTPSETMVYTGADNRTRFSKAVKAMMKHKPRCIICGDDVLCMKLMAELSQLGMCVPGDVRVASFYDSVYLDNSIPPVTSLVFNAEELGATASSVLIDMIDRAPGAPVPGSTLLNFEMLIRKSTM